MTQDRRGGELTAEELEAEDVSQLPNREAMSLISGAAPLPINDADMVGPPVPASSTESPTDFDPASSASSSNQDPTLPQPKDDPWPNSGVSTDETIPTA